MTAALVFISILFILSSHPLVIGFLLILARLLYAFIVAYVRRTSWLAYTLVLVFLRGIIIIILYITSLSSNENIVINFKTIVFAGLSAGVLPFIFKLEIKNSVLSINSYFTKTTFELIHKTYRKILNETSLAIITYLFVVLIVAVKIISLGKGPIKINE